MFSLKNPHTITIGKLGTFLFQKGDYLYVGSAKAGYRKRVLRYFKKVSKFHWHIDYLLTFAEVKGIFFFNNFFSEEQIAKELSDNYKDFSPVIKGFGASDKKSVTHLFYRKGGHL
jgi:Uri superfamily endonuclease